MCLEPMLCKERSHCSEKPPLTMCRESPCAATEIHQSQKKKKNLKKNLSWLSLPKKKASKLWLTFAISFHAVQVLLNSIFFYLGNLLPYELCIPKINSQSLLPCSLQLAQTHVTWALPADSLTWVWPRSVWLEEAGPIQEGLAGEGCGGVSQLGRVAPRPSSRVELASVERVVGESLSFFRAGCCVV